MYKNCAVETVWKGKKLTEYDGVFFTCASSAERFLTSMGKEFGACRVYSIGPKTTECLKRNGLTSVTEAVQADYQALVECVLLGH